MTSSHTVNTLYVATSRLFGFSVCFLSGCLAYVLAQKPTWLEFHGLMDGDCKSLQKHLEMSPCVLTRTVVGISSTFWCRRWIIGHISHNVSVVCAVIVFWKQFQETQAERTPVIWIQSTQTMWFVYFSRSLCKSERLGPTAPANNSDMKTLTTAKLTQNFFVHKSAQKLYLKFHLVSHLFMPEVEEEVMVIGEKAVAPKTTVQDCVTTFVSSQPLDIFIQTTFPAVFPGFYYP